VDSQSFKLLGSSNGAALINRILIENDDTRITHAVTDVSQLNTHQYHDGNFYVGGSDNSYTTVKQTLTPRNLYIVVGGMDTTIPANGGASVIPADAQGITKLNMVPWNESAYAYAHAYGYVGAPATVGSQTVGSDTLAYVDYFPGTDSAIPVPVTASNYLQEGHGVVLENDNAGQDVVSFLEQSGGEGSGGGSFAGYGDGFRRQGQKPGSNARRSYESCDGDTTSWDTMSQSCVPDFQSVIDGCKRGSGYCAVWGQGGVCSNGPAAMYQPSTAGNAAEGSTTDGEMYTSMP